LQPTLTYPILAQEASLSAEPEVSEAPDQLTSPLPVVEPTPVASVEILESPSPEPLAAEVEAPFPDVSLANPSPAPEVSPTPSESPATEVLPENSSSPVEGSDQPNASLDGNYRPNYSVELKDEAGNVVVGTTFTDAPISGCNNDSAGVNDQPNQKDLSKMCVNYSGLPESINVSWNWDDTNFSGANTGDACSLYDTDGDGLANYSLCVGVAGIPATWSYTKLYSCGDGRSDRCDQPTLVFF
ncbi:MAG: hypothetical protein NUV73_03680, partial [Candidatus Daviesbacteria bacterium]|nr:hypothetical protein [Candidatus Daviesbacteria bacterium]